MSEMNAAKTNKFTAKIDNFWYYHKTAVIIGSVLLICLSYLLYASISQVKADTYGVVVTASPLAEEEKKAICAVLGAAVGDLNKDGTEWVTCQFLAFTELSGGTVDQEAYIVFQSSLGSERYEIYLLSNKVIESKDYENYFSDILCKEAGQEGVFLALPEEAYTMQNGERLYLAARKMGTSTKTEEVFYRNVRRTAAALLK